MSSSSEALLDALPNPPGDAAAVLHPDLDQVRPVVHWIGASVDRLNETLGLAGDQSQFLHDLVLQGAFRVFEYWRHGYSDAAKSCLILHWFDQSVFFGMAARRDIFLPESPLIRLRPSDDDAEFLAVFNVAVAERLLAGKQQSQARQTLRNLMARLELAKAELAAMFGVSEQTVEEWEKGAAPIPPERLAKLTEADSALSRLLALFHPERLVLAVRRPAKLFDGERALDWILHGRIREVAERYETALAYQA